MSHQVSSALGSAALGRIGRNGRILGLEVRCDFGKVMKRVEAVVRVERSCRSQWQQAYKGLAQR